MRSASVLSKEPGPRERRGNFDSRSSLRTACRTLQRGRRSRASKRQYYRYRTCFQARCGHCPIGGNVLEPQGKLSGLLAQTYRFIDIGTQLGSMMLAYQNTVERQLFHTGRWVVSRSNLRARLFKSTALSSASNPSCVGVCTSKLFMMHHLASRRLRKASADSRQCCFWPQL